MTSLNRRELLRLFAGVALPMQVAPAESRTVGIIGAGMAGVSLAWLLDGTRNVVLLEAGASVGGNVQTLPVDLDGHQFVVDMGAQYFHPGPYPAYTTLLAHLGLYDPQAGDTDQTHVFPASITLGAQGDATPRFVSPILPGRGWPLVTPWNKEGLTAFGTAFSAAKIYDEADGSWALTLEQWLPAIGLSQPQWEGMVLPWAASLFSGSIEQARGLSARAAMVFAAKALPANPLDPLVYYVLKPGMGEVLRRMVEQFSTVSLVTGARVLYVVRRAQGGFTLYCSNGQQFDVDDLVFAAPAPATRQLLTSVSGTWAQRLVLAGIEFHDATLALHTDPVYAAPQPALWSFLNSAVAGNYCEASMWLGPVIADVPPATSAKLWKSWVTHRTAQPAQVIHEAQFTHMLPTPATLLAQQRLKALQGQGGVWFAGGYLSAYDSQETALLSAIGVAARLTQLNGIFRNVAE